MKASLDASLHVVGCMCAWGWLLCSCRIAVVYVGPRTCVRIMRGGVSALLQGLEPSHVDAKDEPIDEQADEGEGTSPTTCHDTRRRPVDARPRHAPSRRADLQQLLRATTTRPAAGVREASKDVASEAEAHGETSQTRHVPWDGTCKTLVRLSSTSPFPRATRAWEACEAVRRFASATCETSASSCAAAWLRAAHVWTCRCRTSRGWDDAFRSAYYAWRHDATCDVDVQPRHLLVSHPQFSTWFVWEGSAHGCPSAMLIKSTPGARAALDEAGVQYDVMDASMSHPTQGPSGNAIPTTTKTTCKPHARQVEDGTNAGAPVETWWEGGRVVDLEQEKQKRSEAPLRFRGHVDVHGLYEFLLERGAPIEIYPGNHNKRKRRDERRKDKDPCEDGATRLYASLPFVGATIRTMRVDYTKARGAGEASSPDIHFATFKGPATDDEAEDGDKDEDTREQERGAVRWIPPWTVRQVLQAATKCLPDGYEADMRTDACTHAFNGLLDLQTQSQANRPAPPRGKNKVMRHVRYRRGQYQCTWTS
mmetsp:Transcript_6971/g.42673  ORF Transcript_6971/g.42673 Transcript_6971/m.42673 type:complete len:536 (+) Transcript_6971:504-2111(+)